MNDFLYDISFSDKIIKLIFSESTDRVLPDIYNWRPNVQTECYQIFITGDQMSYKLLFTVLVRVMVNIEFLVSLIFSHFY